MECELVGEYFSHKGPGKTAWKKDLSGMKKNRSKDVLLSGL